MRKTTRDALYSSSFAVMAIGAGIAAGGSLLPITVTVGLSFAVVLLANARGWLFGDPAKSVPSPLSGYAVLVLLTGLAVLYVRLAGGETSPLRAVLYLPLLLGAVCFGVRAGLMAGILLALAFLGGALQNTNDALSLRNAVLVAATFPGMAVFAGLLTRRLETRSQLLNSRTDEDSTLLDMSQMINSAYDLNMTLDLILLNVQKISECQSCAVYLKDQSGEMLELRAESVMLGQPSLLSALPLDNSLHNNWSVTGEWRAGDLAVPFYLSDISPDDASRSSALLAVDSRARAIACFPLASLEGLLGMVYVGFDHPNALTVEQIEAMEQVLTRAALPLQRLLQQQDFQSLAYTDVLTGLDNRRRFQQTLTEETARASRYNRPLSMFILDIDHFKQVNDTLGHPAGDALLAQLAVVLSNALRTVDRPARYGGEEFVVLCPETGGEEAFLIAERIRRTVAETAFTLLELAKPVQVTVSIGVAAYPEHALTGTELLNQADKALYTAKASGRNAVRGPGEPEPPLINGASRQPSRARKLSKRLSRAR